MDWQKYEQEKKKIVDKDRRCYEEKVKEIVKKLESEEKDVRL